MLKSKMAAVDLIKKARYGSKLVVLSRRGRGSVCGLYKPSKEEAEPLKKAYAYLRQASATIK